MRHFLHHKGILATIILLSFTCMTVCFSPAEAGLVSTEEVLNGGRSDSDRDRLNAFLERQEVQDRLEAWGMDKESAKARVNALTDEEVAQIVKRLDQLPAGGDAVGTLVFATLLVFFVLLFTDIIGVTDVFPFVKKHD